MKSKILFTLFGILLYNLSNAQCTSYVDNFETGNLSLWTTIGTTITTSTSNVLPAEGVYGCKIVGGSGLHLKGISRSFSAITPNPNTMSWYMKPTGSGLSNYLVAGDNTVTATKSMVFCYWLGSTNEIVFIGTTGASYKTAATANVWHLIELKNIDFITHRFDIYIDGVLKQANFAFRSSLVNSIEKVHLYNFDAGATGNWDNIKFGSSSSIISKASALNATSITGITTDTDIQGAGQTIIYTSYACNLISTVVSSANLGSTTAKVTVESATPIHNTQPYVKRWFEVTPTTQGSGNITFYFTQDDFNIYNTTATATGWPLLPQNSTDAVGKANLRVTKNDGALGVNPVVLTPSSIIWNSLNSYWEVSLTTPNLGQFRFHAVNPLWYVSQTTCNSYFFNNQTITQSGIYFDTLINSSGSDSIITLNLTINHSTSNTINQSACNSYNFNNQTITQSGIYYDTLINLAGCDSIIMLNLTINNSSSNTMNQTICASALPYNWNGQTLTTAGTYTNTATGANGCDSVATLNLTVKQPTASTTNTSVCAASLPYNWNGQTLTTAGTYTNTATGANGCDSVATLNLTVKQSATTTVNTTICNNLLPYSWNGQTLTAAGSYTNTATGASGCDSVATLNLTVNQSTTTVNTTICNNLLPYSWNGQTLTTAGTYTNTATGANGCDSVATLNLTVNQATTSTTNTAICPVALPYSWNGQTLTAAGTYTNTQAGANGCDSVATLNLIIKQPTSSTTILSAVVPYSWNGQTLTAAGTYTKTLTGANGCDSVATLNFTVLSSSPKVTINFVWVPGSQTSTTADFDVSIQNTGNTTLGFNGIIIRGNHASVLTGGIGTISWKSLAGTAPTTVTSGFPWTNYDPITNPTGGFWPNIAANLGYTPLSRQLTYSSSNVFFTNLTAPTIPTAAPLTIGRFRVTVAGGTFIPNAQFGFTWASTAAVIAYVGASTTTTSLATLGTNKIVTTSVDQPLNPVPIGIISGNSTICEGSSANINVAITGGISPYTLIYGNGTNSFTVNNYISGSPIAVSPSTTSTYTITSVSGFTLNHTGSAAITVNLPSSSTNTASACENTLPYIWNGQSLTVPGTYTNTQAGANGCDSLATLNFTVTQTTSSTTNTSVCSSALPYSWNGHTLTGAGTYTKTLTGSNGCDSVATLNLTVKQPTASTTNMAICSSALPYSWNGQTLTTAGTYTKTLTGSNSCDSTATLNFTVIPNSTSTTTASTCNSYSFNNQTLTQSGIYYDTLINATGCDSIITLNLTINNSTSSTINHSACDSYTFNNQILTTSGIYFDTLINSIGCDSIITLNLTINNSTSNTLNQSACNSYTFNNQTLTQSGIYNDTLINSIGCDSIITLNLTINSTSNTLNQSACNSYSFNNQTLTQSGIYYDTLINSVGCDSVITLNLTVNLTSSATTNTTICSSALPYSWNGQSLTVSGIYTNTTTGSNGCDSTTLLYLTVNATSSATITLSGSAPFSWNGSTYTASGIYTYTTINAAGCDSVTTLNLTSTVTVNVTAFIQGYYNGTGMVAARYDNLMSAGSLTPGNATDVDFVTVELYDAINTAAVAYTAVGMLQSNGDLSVSFPGATFGNSYYIVLKHQNSIQLWSANPVTINSTTSYDFSTALTQAYTDGSTEPMALLATGLYGMYSGDITQDEYIDGSDYSAYEVDVDNANNLGLFNLASDLNGDTYVDGSDYPLFDINSTNNLYSQHP